MSNAVISIQSLGKMYKLYHHPADKVLDTFGINRWLFWRRNYFQEFWALRDLNLQITRGERVGIIGRNGAGKSTLLKIISGNISPTEGTVRVNGRVQALLELGTGFHPEFTGRQNISVFLSYQGLSPREIREKEEDIVDFAELEEFIDQPIKTYSGGMYAWLAFSSATVIEPELLIIDEILGAGDAYFAGKCVERMRKLTDNSGATVLFVSHDLGSVQRLCDRVIWLDRGEMQQGGEPLEVIKAYSAMVRKDEEIRLMARELRIRKTQAVSLDSHDGVYDKLLFHLVPAETEVQLGCHRVYSLRLLAGMQEVACIHVGSPMDNAEAHLNYVMDSPGYMDWGASQRDENGTCREYLDLKGKYGHAPFEFAIPKTFAFKDNSNRFSLEIVAQTNTENVAVEVYNGEEYLRLGCLPAGLTTTTLQLPPKLMSPTAPCEPVVADSDETDEKIPSKQPKPAANLSEDTDDEYGTREVSITAVKMLDQNGQETRVFEMQKPIKIVLEFDARERIVNPVFIFCVYFPDGQCATQWVVSSRDLGHESIQGKGSVTFTVDDAILGQAAYVASTGIFKHLSSDGLEAEGYHVLDRSTHFQIVPPAGKPPALESGLCLQAFRAELQCD